jgi:hypothetical protein
MLSLGWAMVSCGLSVPVSSNTISCGGSGALKPLSSYDTC